MASPHPPLLRAARRGGVIGLIAVLLVLAIGLYVVFAMSGGSGGGPGGGGYAGQMAQSRDTARQTSFNINSQQLGILLATHRQERGSLPSSASDLDNPGAFKDAWGNTITFEFSEDPSGATAVTYRSAGPDGEMGNEDDITTRGTLPF